MPARNRTFFLAIILAIAFSFFRGTFDPQPVTSSQDQKAYRYLELENGLDVLLISDPEADHGAASLDVHVGSIQDPETRPGLAHFLEHMLFLGTKAYPTAGEYQSFISQHGGSHNAFTAPEHTNYFFQIDNDQLEPALDRFSRFFHEPLFTEEYVQREKEAVNGEFKSKYKNDFRRIQYATKAIMNQAHPASHFATGNLSTLSDNDTSKVREDLLAFYDRYYRASIMKLVVYGSQDLDTLASWVEPRFSPVPSGDVKIDAYPKPIFEQTGIDLFIKPVKELYSLSFTFELDTALNDYLKKPSHYIGHILGHEGDGSLLAWLKQKGWAEGLSAGLQTQIRNNSAFQVNIQLTPNGLEHTDAISEQVFAYIRLVQNEGVQNWVFEELKQLGHMHFTFEEGRNPSELVQTLSMNMQDYKVQDILRGPYLWEEFDKDRIQQLLEKMTPENVIRTLVSPTVSTDKTDPWFDAPYSTREISQDTLWKWADAKLADGLSIPKPNPFIPEDTRVLADNSQTQPEILMSKPGLTVWHMQDVSFDGPQSSIYAGLHSPLSQQGAESQVLSEVWVKLLNDHLNTLSYPAALAGQGYSLYSHMRGIGIQLYGYRDKQDVLLEKVIEAITHYQPTKEKWEIARTELLRAYGNALKQTPYKRTIAELNQVLVTPSYSEKQLMEALNNATLDDLLALKAKYFDEINVTVLGHGNVSRDQLEQSASIIEKAIVANAQPVTVNKKTLKQLDSGVTKHTVTADHNDSVMTLYLQAETDSLKERALIGLVAHIVKAPYYTLMRTEREHGYIVFGTAYPILEQGGMAFIVQSPKTSSRELYKQTRAFISDYLTVMESMDDATFEANKQGLVTNLLKKPLNLEEKSSELWRDIDRENDQFDTKEKLAEFITSFTKMDVINYMRDHMDTDDARYILLSYDLEN